MQDKLRSNLRSLFHYVCECFIAQKFDCHQGIQGKSDSPVIHTFIQHLLSTYLPDAMLGTGYMKMNKPQGKEMNCYLYYVS